MYFIRDRVADGVAEDVGGRSLTVLPDSQSSFEMRYIDAIRAIEQRVNQREFDHLRLGPRDHGAQQARLTFR